MVKATCYIQINNDTLLSSPFEPWSALHAFTPFKETKAPAYGSWRHHSLKFQDSHRRQCDYNLLVIYASEPADCGFNVFPIKEKQKLFFETCGAKTLMQRQHDEGDIPDIPPNCIIEGYNCFILVHWAAPSACQSTEAACEAKHPLRNLIFKAIYPRLHLLFNNHFTPFSFLCALGWKVVMKNVPLDLHMWIPLIQIANLFGGKRDGSNIV